MGPAPQDPRYACAQAAGTSGADLVIFTYGGSTVYGIPTPQLGFVEQLRHVLEKEIGSKSFRLCNIARPALDSTGVLLDVKRTLQFKPDVAIVLSGHNEFLLPKFETPFERGLRQWASDTAMVRAWNRALQANPKALRARPVVFDRAGAEYAARVRRYRENLTAIVRLARDAKVPLILGTLPANLRDWPPVFQKINSGYGRVSDEHNMTAILRNISDNQFVEAKRFIANGPVNDLATPVGIWAKARIAMAEGDPNAANNLLLAKDADPIPWRALSVFNDYVRKLVVQSGKSVHLLDAENMIQKASESGAPGFELIVDNCHPSPFGNFLITRQLLQLVASTAHRGRLLNGHRLDYDKNDFEIFVASQPNINGLIFKSHLSNALYSMKEPFYNFAAAEMYLHLADVLRTSDWRVSANKAVFALLDGRLEVGSALLSKAVRQGATRRRLLDRRRVPYMREALKHARLAMKIVCTHTHAAPRCSLRLRKADSFAFDAKEH